MRHWVCLLSYVYTLFPSGPNLIYFPRCGTQTRSFNGSVNRRDRCWDPTWLLYRCSWTSVINNRREPQTKTDIIVKSGLLVILKLGTKSFPLRILLSAEVAAAAPQKAIASIYIFLFFFLLLPIVLPQHSPASTAQKDLKMNLYALTSVASIVPVHWCSPACVGHISATTKSHISKVSVNIFKTKKKKKNKVM